MICFFPQQLNSNVNPDVFSVEPAFVLFLHSSVMARTTVATTPMKRTVVRILDADNRASLVATI